MLASGGLWTLGGSTRHQNMNTIMKMKETLGLALFAALIVTGCATTDGQKPEKGLHGTIAYLVEVESSEPGARVEANNEYEGH